MLTQKDSFHTTRIYFASTVRPFSVTLWAQTLFYGTFSEILFSICLLVENVELICCGRTCPPLGLTVKTQYWESYCQNQSICRCHYLCILEYCNKGKPLSDTMTVIDIDIQNIILKVFCHYQIIVPWSLVQTKQIIKIIVYIRNI